MPASKVTPAPHPDGTLILLQKRWRDGARGYSGFYVTPGALQMREKSSKLKNDEQAGRVETSRFLLSVFGSLEWGY